MTLTIDRLATAWSWGLVAGLLALGSFPMGKLVGAFGLGTLLDAAVKAELHHG